MQSSSVAIMATGMVLVIVTRNIDLSVGSMLGFIGMVMGVIQTDLLPKLLGFEHPATWMLTLAAGLVLGVVLGALQGFVIAYLGIPAFIVTLGGLLVWRGAAWWVTQRPDRRAARRDGSGSWAAARKARSARPGAGSVGAVGLRRRRAAAGARPRPAQEIRLPAAADGGRNLSRRRRLRADPRRGRRRQRLSVADRQRAPLRRSATISRFPKAACSSRTASRFRC